MFNSFKLLLMYVITKMTKTAHQICRCIAIYCDESWLLNSKYSVNNLITYLKNTHFWTIHAFLLFGFNFHFRRFFIENDDYIFIRTHTEHLFYVSIIYNSKLRTCVRRATLEIENGFYYTTIIKIIIIVRWRR